MTQRVKWTSTIKQADAKEYQPETPKIIKKDVIEEINLAVQVNGKTRDIIKILRDLTETDVKSIVQKKSKATKYIENKKINKIIFVKNRIINYII